MAIFSKLILGSTLLSSVALAAPFGIPHGVKPAWTVWKTDYTTVDMTTTIYIDGTSTLSGANIVATAAPATTSAAAEASAPSVAPTEAAPTFSAPATTMSTAVVPTAAPAAVSPPASSSVAAEVVPSAPATTAAPAVATTSTTPAAVAPTSAAAAPAVAPASGDASTGGSSSGPSSASDTASCEGEGNACEGDITYYGGGLGACGVNVDPNGNGIALAAEFMGAQSNGNPYCGMTMTIFNPATGQTTTGVVQDKCPGCSGRSIDMTLTNMNSITNGQAVNLGRVSGVEWWFN